MRTRAAKPSSDRARLVAIGAGAVIGVGIAVAAVVGLLRLLSPPPLAVGNAASPTVAGVVTTPDPKLEEAAGEKTRRPTATRLLSIPQTVFPILTSTYDWPEEPKAPVEVDDARFTEALVLLCGPHADREVRTWYAPWLLRAAREFSTDPFLMGGLMFRMSGCTQKQGRRVGLLGLDPALYQTDVREGVYHYRGFAGGHFRERSLVLQRFPFQKDFLKSPESNLYFGAAFLRAWQEQERGLRAAFVQKSEYRHYVSHYLWGDVVASHREEDYVLVDRRRLLEYYGALRPRPPVTWRGFTLGCPLDGCPRVVISTLGDSRAGGKREHAGNDFESTLGEPIRAIADGKVIFAGVDLPGRSAASRLPIWAQRDVDPGSMGAGGLYVCIDHGISATDEKLVSCYMHLEAATVSQDRLVKRGEQIGRVGTSGIKQSRPHLHFELHASDGVHASLEVLRGIAIGNPTVHAPPPPAEVEEAANAGSSASL